MSPDGYQPDRRLCEIFDAVDQATHEMADEICPLFAELAGTECRYTDLTLLGQGGLKDVYKAYDAQARQWVALARLRKNRGLRYYDLFVREAWLISSLTHPNIIKVHDAGIDVDHRPFFTMDLKRGSSLADLIEENKTTRDDLLDIFLKVCDAVAYAHDQGVIHLDLKPDNIQCDRFGEVLVCDWGMGHSLRQDGLKSKDLAKRRTAYDALTERVCGTPGYMAPEQIAAGRAKNARTDVYALGCMLHAILTGEPPFTGSANRVIEQTSTSEVARLRPRFPDRRIPAGLEAVVLKAVSLDPANRYASAIELKGEIHQYMGGFSTGAEESGFFKEAALFIARNRKASVVTLIAFVAMTVLSVLFIQRLGLQQMATEEERGRANQLLSKVNVLSAEYAELFEESAVSKKALAEKLALSANSLKNLGIFDRPAWTIKDSMQLVDMALLLDPNCNAAKWQRFTLYCLQLNFQQALKDPVYKKMDQLHGIKLLAQAFPDYNFNGNRRPDEKQLIAFLEQASQMEPQPWGYIERMFIVHLDALKDTRELRLDERFAFVEYFNGGPAHCSLSYNQSACSLLFESDAPLIRLALYSSGGSGRSLLRFLPVKQLALNTSGLFHLSDLQDLDIESLDLRNCSEVELDSELRLPQLRRITVRAGQFSPGDLKTRIRSTFPFDVEEL